MHDMPQIYTSKHATDQEEMRADLLHRALEETGKLSTALDLAERAWRFIHPCSMTVAMVADLKASIWAGAMETEPAMPPPNAAAAPAPATPPPPPPPCASDGMGTQVLSTAPPVPVATEPADPAPAPAKPIPQIYQPPAPAGPEEGQVRVWTAAEEDRLRQLYHAGKTDKQIGKELGRSSKAVSIRIAKLKLKQERAGQGNDGGDG